MAFLPLIPREYASDSSYFKIYLLQYPFRGLCKLGILYFQKGMCHLFPGWYGRWQQFQLKRRRRYARPISDAQAKLYCFDQPYYDIQIHYQTVPACIIKPGASISFTQFISEQTSGLLLGFTPLLSDLNPASIRDFSLALEIQTGMDSKRFHMRFPWCTRLKDRTMQMGYYYGDRPIPIYFDLRPYQGKSVTIQLEGACQPTSASIGDELLSVSYPQLIGKSVHPKTIIVLSMESLTDLRYLKHRYPGLPTLPNIERLLQDSVSYPNCYTTSDITLSFSSSLVSGLLSSQHGIGDYRIPGESFYQSIVNREIPTLAEQLKSWGYFTAMFSLFPRFSPKLGLARGCDIYQHWMGKESATLPSMEHVIQHLQTFNDIPMFVFAHLDYLHEPYRTFRQHLLPALVEAEEYMNDDRLSLFFSQLRYMDYQIGLLLNYLKDSGLYASTCLILTGDHGCDLTWKKHSKYSLYEERVRVPLIVKYPSWSDFRLGASRRVNSVPEIHRILYGIHQRMLPEYLSRLPQYDQVFNSMVFSETIMNPEQVWDRHTLAISDGIYKYVCWNRINWKTGTILEKKESKLFKYTASYDIDEQTDLSFSDPEAHRRYESLAYQVLDRNLSFLSSFPSETY